MYVITFYSFKGGVGRSMALANVGALLAKKGRRVLLVDFDLEAPGLTTFNFAKSKQHAPGIVDFVTEYIETAKVPDASKFMFASDNFIEGPGSLWLMPAGKPDETYQRRSNSINWQQLYAEKDGYLLFEDLKLQWEQCAKPDYVLIDSRTGYTDIGGICTRQLPNAVCLLYFPNQQNLVGLRKIVHDIQAQNESLSAQESKIEIFLAAANVPDLDDENSILSERLADFENLLDFQGPRPALIHHYQSLSLLTQAVFTLERPKSRLAKEYEDLSLRITRSNLADRDVAVRRLRATVPPNPSEELPRLEAKQLDTILSSHPDDGEVLYWVARVRRNEGVRDEARLLMSRAIEKGYKTSDSLLDLAQLSVELNDSDEAKSAIKLILGDEVGEQIEATSLARAIRLGLGLGLPERYLGESGAVWKLSLDEQRLLLALLQDSLKEYAVVNVIAKHALALGRPAGNREFLLFYSGLAYFAHGELQSAIDTFHKIPEDSETWATQLAFNLGMAFYWLNDHAKARYHFEKLEAQEQSLLGENANYIQCMAFAKFALGQHEPARKILQRAVQQIRRVPRRTYSCWTYLRVTSMQFESDVRQMEQLFSGKPVHPRFMDVKPDLTPE